MEWAWTRVAIVGAGAMVFVWGAAFALYAASPTRLQNRLLALWLACWAIAFGAGGGLMYATSSAAEAYAWQLVAYVFFGAALPLYLAFLSTLPTPLARPLARARPLLYGVAVAAAALPIASPRLFVTSVMPGTFAAWDNVPGPLALPIFWIQMAVSVLGLVLAVSAWRRSRAESLARHQAIAYLVAFGWIDSSSFLMVSVALLSGFTEWMMIAWNVAMALFVPILGYGILKTQLFDVDLKIKWTLRRGTVASVFLAVFFVASAVAQQYLERYGVLLGGVAVGLLLFAFRPIERAADRLADHAMPGVQDTTEYRTVRKREVYRAAIEGALEDGGVSEKERAMLARLAHSLGIDPLEMHEIEREARASRGVA